ncbi:Acyltransferase calJ [Cladobotryum mycophilum]|uniref:Acyltransferase calJ n=1 Tax=Cladobotryum mycophilum TaxID=491253 RepID=A0ABR0SXI3_9HYPO
MLVIRLSARCSTCRPQFAVETFESKLAQATSPAARDLLGAIGLVVDNKGQTLYHHAAGYQSLDDDSPPLDPDSTVALYSAGKLITHIAALQFIDRGVIQLDEPISRYIPEIGSLPVITSGPDGEPFALRPPTKEITMHHLLLHTSGLSDDAVPVIAKYLASDAPKPATKEDDDYTIKRFSLPLIFEPGEGFAYGASIHWLQLLVKRLSGNPRFGEHIYKNVFEPLGMSSSTYLPRDRADVWGRRLQMVSREGSKLIPDDDATQGLMCSVSDMGKLLSDLISPSPKLLKPESIELLFSGQLSGSALENLHANHENYAFCAGKPGSLGPPAVNWSAAGLVVEEELPLSKLPRGTVIWDGMAKTIWAMNRDRGIAMFWAVQHLPYDDGKVDELAMSFMNSIWAHYNEIE